MRRNLMLYHSTTGHWFPHGIMFHHFHDGGQFFRSEGSISEDQLEGIIDFIGRDNIVSPSDWIELSEAGGLRPDQVCLTFDDALKCQVAVAAPVLRRNNIRAFFFVYSSVIEGQIERLELLRYVRNACYSTIDAFYDDFYRVGFGSDAAPLLREGLARFPGQKYLSEFPFYSLADRKYRFVRDHALPAPLFHDVVDRLLNAKIADIPALARTIWMSRDDVKSLHSEGHCVGLHSYSHPMQLGRLTAREQEDEYRKNFDHLAGLLGTEPRSMSHPCNSYGADTLKILKRLGIVIGFCATVKGRDKRGLEYPREDHANIVRLLP